MKDNYRKCAKCNASTAQDSQLVLHRFPKPGPSNTQRMLKWAKFCYPKEKWECIEFQKVLYKSHKMLCSKHFPKSAFVQDHLLRQKLHRYAGPTEQSATSTEISHIEMPNAQLAEPGITQQPSTVSNYSIIDDVRKMSL